MTVIRPKAFQAIAARHSEASAPDDARAEPQRGMLEPTVTRLPALRAALEEEDAHGDGMLRRVRTGLLVVGLTFGGFGLWAATASLDGAVIATGALRVEGARKAVQHLEGGVVREIRVREGDLVAAGQVLVVLDDTVSGAGVRSLRAERAELEIRRARLVAERDGKDALAAPAALAAGDAQIAEIVDGQRRLFEARRASRGTAIALLRQRQEQLAAQIEGLTAQRESRRAQLGFYEEELTGLRELFEKGLTTKGRLLEMERQGETARGGLAELAAGVAEAEMRVGETELEILRLEESFQESVATELREVEAEMNRLAERAVQAEDHLARGAIRAPRSGRVLNLAVHTEGAVISPGETVMEIVPQDDALVVAAQVAPPDVDKALPGAPAKVRLPAFNQRVTPELNGVVARVSADLIVDAESGAGFYEAVIELTPSELERLSGLELKPGMPAEVFISTGERSPLSYLMKPVVDSLSGAFREE